MRDECSEITFHLGRRLHLRAGLGRGNGGGDPDACFDHIFVKGLGMPVASPLVKIGGSDHLPVAVDLGLMGR
jgi:endonuclease/exonuclease/phosphatase (EEP) superfamily protein YafD